MMAGRRIAPKGIHIFNLAFDVTPPQLITTIVTEKGLLRQPLSESIRNAFKLPKTL